MSRRLALIGGCALAVMLTSACGGVTLPGSDTASQPVQTPVQAPALAETAAEPTTDSTGIAANADATSAAALPALVDCSTQSPGVSAGGAADATIAGDEGVPDDAVADAALAETPTEAPVEGSVPAETTAASPATTAADGATTEGAARSECAVAEAPTTETTATAADEGGSGAVGPITVKRLRTVKGVAPFKAAAAANAFVYTTYNVLQARLLVTKSPAAAQNLTQQLQGLGYGGRVAAMENVVVLVVEKPAPKLADKKLQQLAKALDSSLPAGLGD